MQKMKKNTGMKKLNYQVLKGHKCKWPGLTVAVCHGDYLFGKAQIDRFMFFFFFFLLSFLCENLTISSKSWIIKRQKRCF